MTLKVLRTNLRRALNVARWLAGRRGYPWTASPVHQLLASVARVAHRGRTPLRRLAYVLLSALLKHREQVYADKMNFVATVRGPVSQEVLRNMVTWQRSILRNPEIPPTMKIHGNLCVAGGAEDVQLERLFSLLCVSEVFNNFNIFFDERPASESLPLILTKAEQRRSTSQNIRFDLDAPRPAEAGAVELEGMPRALAPLLEPRRALTSYLKVAHPRAFVVAVSLPEDEDGFCDDALAEWMSSLRDFRRSTPGIVFCLLNRTRLGQDTAAPPPVDVAPVRSLGFGLQDAIAMAQGADAFIGCLDPFGLAAIGAGRSGVYLNPTGGDRHDPERLVWWFVNPTPDQCLAALRVLLRQRGPAWLRGEQQGG